MSATDRFINKRPFLTHIITLLTGLVVAFAAYAWNASDIDSRELQKKIDSKASAEEVREVKQWSKVYTDQSIANHEKVDAARYQGISDMFKAIKDEQSEMRRDIKELLKSVN